MNTQNEILPEGDNDPLNTDDGGPEPEINKDFTPEVKEEDTENSDPESTPKDNGKDKCSDEEQAKQEPANSPENPFKGIENGDEDHLNPYPDERNSGIER